MKSLSCVRLFAAPWTVAHQAPPSMEFSRQEYWSGLPFPSPGDLPDPGIEPGSPAMQADAQMLYHLSPTALVAQTVKRLPTVQETRVQSLGQKDLLEKGMATHSSILAPPPFPGLRCPLFTPRSVLLPRDRSWLLPPVPGLLELLGAPHRTRRAHTEPSAPTHTQLSPIPPAP